MDCDMDVLVGKRILGVRLSEDRGHLVFVTAEGAYSYLAEGDCCSSSWFEHASGVSYLVGGTVAKVEQVDGWDVTPDGHYGKVDAYAWAIDTDKGSFKIEMRNESNGYYSGWARAAGVATAAEVEALRDIAEDF